MQGRPAHHPFRDMKTHDTLVLKGANTPSIRAATQYYTARYGMRFSVQKHPDGVLVTCRDDGSDRMNELADLGLAPEPNHTVDKYGLTDMAPWTFKHIKDVDPQTVQYTVKYRNGGGLGKWRVIRPCRGETGCFLMRIK